MWWRVDDGAGWATRWLWTSRTPSSVAVRSTKSCGSRASIDVATWSELEHDRLAPVVAAEADERLGELTGLRDAVLMLLRAAAVSDPWNTADTTLVNRYMHTHAPVLQLDPGRGAVVRAQLDMRGSVDALLGQMAAATLDFLNGPDRHVLGRCDAPSCGQLFLRRRADQRWCCTACGTRARVARHTQRRTK